jgi:hypothetical protein
VIQVYTPTITICPYCKTDWFAEGYDLRLINVPPNTFTDGQRIDHFMLCLKCNAVIPIQQAKEGEAK